MLRRRLVTSHLFLPVGLAAVLCCGAAATTVLAQSERGLSQFSVPTLSQTSTSSATKKAALPKYIELGRSVKGTPITAAIYGTGKKRVILFGGIHGDEPDSSIVAKALMGSLGQEALPEELTLIIVPDANPDGLLANTRVNAKGVDINRNFPSASWSRDYTDNNQFPGTEPASEPETRAIMKLMESYPPDFIITIHAALGCVNWDGTGEPLAHVIAGINGYPLCADLGYATPGSLGTYMGTDKKLPFVTIELRSKRPSELVQENLPALRAVLSYMASSR